MADVIFSGTLNIGAGATTNIAGVTGSYAALSLHVLLRTPDTGILVGGSHLGGSASGYELIPNREYHFDLRSMGNDFPTSSEGQVYAMNNNSSGSATISFVATALRE